MEKPRVKLVGQDGNVFNLLGLCTKALKRVGQRQQADELSAKVLDCKSYSHALTLMMDYVRAE